MNKAAEARETASRAQSSITYSWHQALFGSNRRLTSVQGQRTAIYSKKRPYAWLEANLPRHRTSLVMTEPWKYYHSCSLLEASTESFYTCMRLEGGSSRQYYVHSRGRRYSDYLRNCEKIGLRISRSWKRLPSMKNA